MATVARWEKGEGWYRLVADGHSFILDEYSDGTCEGIIDVGTPTVEDLGMFASVRAAKTAVKKRLAGLPDPERKPCPACGTEATVKKNGGLRMHHDPRRSAYDPRGLRCFGRNGGDDRG